MLVEKSNVVGHRMVEPDGRWEIWRGSILPDAAQNSATQKIISIHKYIIASILLLCYQKSADIFCSPM